MVAACRSLRAVDPFRGGSGVVYFVVNNKDYKRTAGCHKAGKKWWRCYFVLLALW